MAYLATLEREWRSCKIAVGGYCSSQRLYSIPYLPCLIIFFNKKNIKLLKWHPILTPTIGTKTLFMDAKTLFRVTKWHLAPLFWKLPLELLLVHHLHPLPLLLLLILHIKLPFFVFELLLTTILALASAFSIDDREVRA